MPDRPCARREGLISEHVENDLLVYDTQHKTAHSLTASAVSVWERCDGHHTIAQIARELELDRAIVEQAVAELEDCALLVEPAPEGVVRRAALKRIAQAGGAAIVATPLISSLAIPPAAAAASGTCSSVGKFCVLSYPTTSDCTGPVVDAGLSRWLPLPTHRSMHSTGVQWLREARTVRVKQL